jgi:hypothetical protein
MMFRPVVIAVHRRERRLTRLAIVELCGSRHVDLIIPFEQGPRGRGAPRGIGRDSAICRQSAGSEHMFNVRRARLRHQ